jgi:LacI family transcriptional regulator
MATIRDVAKLAGASATAVSAVLHPNKQTTIRVGAATRERIRSAAQELNYTPNYLARSLVTGRTGVLGLVFPYSSAFIDRGPFCTHVMAGVLMLHTAVGDDWNAVDDDRALINPLVDGLLLVLPTPNSPVIARCHQEPFPYVALGYDPQGDTTIYAVNSDDETGGFLATRHLLEEGHRRIAYLVAPERVAGSPQRHRGYLRALREAGITPDPDWVSPIEHPGQSDYTAMRRLLDRPVDRRPTAVFAFNDPAAEAAIIAIRDCGLRVPEDVAVVGFDDTVFATTTQPQLTSVHTPIREMALLATEMLIARVEKKEIRERQPVLPVSLTVRQSSRLSAS